MVAGIILAAAADELTIAHPSHAATVSTTALILGGPALSVLGNVLFKWTLWGHAPPSRWAALAGLTVLIPVFAMTTLLTLSILATLVLIGLAASDLVLSQSVHPEAVLAEA